jgi:hypothetical protein
MTPNHGFVPSDRSLADFRESQKTGDSKAPAHSNEVLLDWILTISRKRPHDEAVNLFIQKVMREKLNKRSVQWAYSHAAEHPGALAVISDGIQTLDRTRPLHWG